MRFVEVPFIEARFVEVPFIEARFVEVPFVPVSILDVRFIVAPPLNLTSQSAQGGEMNLNHEHTFQSRDSR